MKKRYIFLILFIPFAICIGSLLWYRSRPQPLPTVTPGPTPLVTATIPPSKISSLDPAWSPDGSRIAYILIRDNIPTLVVRDLETGEDLHLVGPDLKFTREQDVKMMIKIKSYRGVRHMFGLPVRGQRTKSSFRKGRTVGVVRKKIQPTKKKGKK